MDRITYTNKEDRRTSGIPAKNKIVAADMNEIKTVTNAIIDKLETVKIPQSIAITAADFSGDVYVNTLLINKTPVTDFNIWTNDGSGVLLKYNDGYTFTTGTGTVTMPSGNYRLEIYKNLV